MNYLFGPLGKEYCSYFLILAIFTFFVFIMTAITSVMYISKFYKKMNAFMYLSMAHILFTALIGYFVNRLLYSMCISSIH